MKVLLVHDYGTPTGGAELQMFALRRLLRERGHDARLFASDATLASGAFEADYACHGASGRMQVMLQTANPSAWSGLRRVLREFQPDIVHVRMFLWQLSPLILPLIRGYASVFHAATFKCICPTGFKLLPDGSQCHQSAGMACLRNGCVTAQTWALSMCQLAMFRRWQHSFDAFIALSEHMRRTLEIGGVSPVTVVHNGVPWRPMRAPLSGDPVIGFAGRLSREKGVDVLLRAFSAVQSRHPKVRLVIAGEGPQGESLRKLAESLGVAGSIAWLGHLSRSDMEREFDRVWVQAIPSLWNEAFGNVATEASMRGTAVVCTDTGGLAEIVADGETGTLTPPGDAGALAQGLERFISDRELAERTGAAGRHRALNLFTEEQCVSNVVTVYRRAMASRGLTFREAGPQLAH